jgi:hypothetical protein
VSEFSVGRKPLPVPNAANNFMAAVEQYGEEALANLSCGTGKEDLHNFS